MTIVDYDTLVDAVKRWAGRSSDTDFDSSAKDAVNLCENELDRDLRVPEMVVGSAFESDKTFESLPADLLKLKSVALVGDSRERPLLLVPDEAIGEYAYRTSNSYEPRYYTLIGNQMRLAPAPTATAKATIRLVYYAKVPRLSALVATSIILTSYTDIYLYGSLAHLAGYIEDDAQLQKWRGLFREGIRQANRRSVTRDATHG